MKKSLLPFLLLLLTFSTYSQEIQEESDSIRRAKFNDFLGKIVGTNTETPKASFVFNILKSPQLEFIIPLNDGVFNQFYLDGKIASSNEYTPLIKKGEWLPDIGFNFNYTRFLTTTTKFYKTDIDKLFNGDISKATIDEASQLFWSWLNFKAGYNYSNLETYNGNLTVINSEKFSESNLNSFLIRTDLNVFFYPSKNLVPWLSINGKLGYGFKTNDNNYSSLKSINIREITLVTDSNGNTLEVSSNENSIKQGDIRIMNSSNINFNLMALFSPSKDFYIGLSTFGKRTLTTELESTDVGFGITIPITKEKGTDKTLASFTLKYDIPDIANNLNDIAVKEKGILGFAIGVPVNIYGN